MTNGREMIIADFSGYINSWFFSLVDDFVYRVIFWNEVEQKLISSRSTLVSRAETSATCSLGLTICFHQFLAREIKNSVLGVNFNFGVPFSENYTIGLKLGQKW